MNVFISQKLYSKLRSLLAMVKKSLPVLAFLAIPILVNAQTHIDTLSAELGDIVVVGYQENRSILETPGSISFVNPELISGFDNSSMVYGLNTVAGVRMEERATGSYRISIRGSSLRSPFGIRNVKIYWNGIPFTEPTGTTFLNLLDVSNMQQVEVIKGPAGSVYGVGNGGVLLINSTAPVLSRNLNSETTVGSFDRVSYNLAYHDTFENGNLSFKYATTKTDGYREQSFLDRKVIEVSGSTEYLKDRSIDANILYSDLNYGIPGGLNKTRFKENPRQARQGNPFALGSVNANASVKHNSLLFGLTHRHQINQAFSNESSAFGAFSDFENPFNLDYKIDSRKSGGLRLKYALETEINGVKAMFILGTELQASNYAARNFENDLSRVGALNFDDELKVKSMLIFGNVQIDLPDDWFITAGLSFNNFRYDINRLFSADTSEFGQIAPVKKDFEPQFIPRIGAAKKLSNQITAHASISSGFSPPSLDEVRTNEGSINLDLEAERGTNYEAGIRGNAFEGRVGFDAVWFFFKLKESIIQQTSERGTVVFRNAGSTNQQGFELNANYLLVEKDEGFLRRAQLNIAYSYHDFEFKDYATADGDFSGNQLTGVAPHVFFGSLNLDIGPGFYANFSYNFVDEIPLEDDNSVYSDSHQLVQTKLGWKSEVSSRFFVDLYFGIDNLLDEAYSRGYDINAFGGRYYQPAPERNWFLGVRLNYKSGA